MYGEDGNTMDIKRSLVQGCGLD